MEVDYSHTGARPPVNRTSDVGLGEGNRRQDIVKDPKLVFLFNSERMVLFAMLNTLRRISRIIFFLCLLVALDRRECSFSN
jgi:hypothetical protein